MTFLGKSLRSFFLPAVEVSQALGEMGFPLAKNDLFVNVCGIILMRLHILLHIVEGKGQQCV